MRLNSVLQEVDLGRKCDLANDIRAAEHRSRRRCQLHRMQCHHDRHASRFRVLPTAISSSSPTPRKPSRGTTVTGDVVIDLGDMENVGGNNPNHTPQPVWAWNEFNHLDINRRPY